ncbi:MAG: hypothetical protein HUK21_12475 [Fibrobacteraceae bacterium]|nr:hypothetical protein [Fibrobacteraceae bacterium]
MNEYPMHEGQTEAEPLMVQIPLSDYEELKNNLLELHNKLMQVEGEKIAFAQSIEDIIVNAETAIKNRDRALCNLRAWAWSNYNAIGMNIKRNCLYWVKKSEGIDD